MCISLRKGRIAVFNLLDKNICSNLDCFEVIWSIMEGKLLSETGKVYLIVVKRFSEVYLQDWEAVLIVNILCIKLAGATILMLQFKKHQLGILQNIFLQFNNHVEIHLAKYIIYLDNGSVIG